MNEHVDSPETEVPAIGISFKHQLDDYREIVFQGYVSARSSDEEVNELLDKLTRASDRQKAKTHLPTVRSLLELKKEALKTETANAFGARQELEAFDAMCQRQATDSNRRNWKPTPGQNQERAKLQAKIGSSEQNVAVLKKEIDAYARQVGDMQDKLGAEG